MCGTQTQVALKLLKNSAFQLSSMRTFNVCIHRSMVTKQLTFLAPLCATKQCHKLFRNGAKCFVSPLTLACFTQGQSSLSCTYATKSGKGLADEILKQKLGAMSQSDASAKPQDSANKSSSDDKKKNEDSWFSNKNAWKLGLISLSVMGAFMCGQMLVIWGKTILYIFPSYFHLYLSYLLLYKRVRRGGWNGCRMFRPITGRTNCFYHR